MKRVLGIAAVLVALAIGTVFAQQATLNTPVARPAEDNLRAETLHLTRDLGGRWEIQVSVRDNAGNEIRRQVFSGPDEDHAAATALALATAYTSVRAGETGGLVRRLDFRLLGFLSDHGYITGVTLVP